MLPLVDKPSIQYIVEEAAAAGIEMVSDPPALKRMTHLYEKNGNHIVGVQPVPYSEVNKYGILMPGIAEGRVHAAAVGRLKDQT